LEVRVRFSGTSRMLETSVLSISVIKGRFPYEERREISKVEGPDVEHSEVEDVEVVMSYERPLASLTSRLVKSVRLSRAVCMAVKGKEAATSTPTERLS
jgi:hypothetical protein